MICLDEARMNVCAQAVGVAYRCIAEAIEYAKQRVAFGQPIMHHQGIQFLLAELATELAAARSLWLMAVHELERGPTRKASALASMAKNACTTIGMKAPVEAIQVFGGAGLSKELPLERMMRDAKAFQIFDGPTQIHNIIIGRHLEKAGLPFD
jgi:alkylation response protein AidB-like acyl-CoA dehydrogenase